MPYLSHKQAYKIARPHLPPQLSLTAYTIKIMQSSAAVKGFAKLCIYTLSLKGRQKFQAALVNLLMFTTRNLVYNAYESIICIIKLTHLLNNKLSLGKG